MQTDLEPNFQELFFENLPYQPQEPVHASKLPTTTVSLHKSLFICFFVCQISVAFCSYLDGIHECLAQEYVKEES